MGSLLLVGGFGIGLGMNEAAYAGLRAKLHAEIAGNSSENVTWITINRLMPDLKYRERYRELREAR